MEFIDQSLSDLFVDLHLSGLWPDGKAISDAEMLFPAEYIMASYAAQKARGPVDLEAFHRAHFRPLEADAPGYHTDPAHGPRDHLEALWPWLMRPADDPSIRSTRVPMPFPYVVVGGRFQEAYYWDSYFTQLGLLRSGRLQAARDMLDNFAHAIGRFGFVPNGFRSYYLTRSQPPFFWAMVQDYAAASGEEAAVLAHYLPALEAEHAFFASPPRHHLGLARYWDASDGPRIEMYATDLEWHDHAAARPGFYRDLRAACESGWDFSSRWLADPSDLGTIRTTDIWPVDLNALLLGHETLLARAAALHAPERAEGYAAAAQARAAAIRDRFWNAQTGFFHDRLIGADALTPVVSAAGLFPLWTGAASPEQAASAAAVAEARLLAPDGLLSTDLRSGQQWDSPNGWAPLQWVAVQGLRRYGHHALAGEIRRRWLATCEAVFRETGKFVEKYNVLDRNQPGGGGEYALQDGFGWTNGVYLDLLQD
ncbi:trehalase family glycosidase [Mangrovicoccus algicola]|uniref:Trehalase n=1 Tax=Mangrovicoccus algicola TaxID=2771008 RepID=A0A8J6Z3J8_9RHOB|nr:trehalase family glycosidase [Mangrovicoccus algicola]MBE3636819.1 trehalase [Mangrovicoccus algicola]